MDHFIETLLDFTYHWLSMNILEEKLEAVSVEDGKKKKREVNQGDIERSRRGLS